MRLIKTHIILPLLTLVLFSTGANARFILNNNTSVDALVISESFVDFYNRGGSVAYSSQTGFEKNNNLVLFLAQYLGNFALIGLVDGTSDVGDNTGGSLTLGMNDSSTFSGMFSFIDDPSESRNVGGRDSQIFFEWQDERNDGFIYTIDNTGNVSLNVVLQSFIGITGVTFINFENNDSSEIEFSDLNRQFTISSPTAVASPSSFMILVSMVSLMFFVRARD